MPTVADKKTMAIAPFVLEVDAKVNGPAIMNTDGGLRNERLRGRWSRRNMRTLDTMISEGMGQLHDDIPGLRIRVNPRERLIVIYDPLEGDPDLMAKVNAAAKADRLVGQAGYKPVKKRQRKFSEDEFKTLLIYFRECEGSTVAVSEGQLPTDEQIESLPGRRLNMPCDMVKGPKYYDQTETWEQMLEAWTRKQSNMPDT